MNKFYLSILFISSFAYSQSVVKTYYDPLYKTQLKEVYQVKENTPTVNGYYKAYDEFGNLMIHRNYINNIQNGKSTTYYGAAEASLMYDNVRQICLGKVSGIFNYKDGLQEGEQLKYDYTEKGKRYLKSKEIFSKGEMIEYIEFSPNNQIMINNVLNGECASFYENGNKFNRYYRKDGKQEGNYEGWYESGQIQIKGKFINDEKDGEWIEYNEDGTIQSKISYELGKKLPTVEEQMAEEKRQLEEQRKLEEKQRIKDEEYKKYEIEKLKKLEESRIRQELSKLTSEFYKEREMIKSKYQYWDKTSYRYEKPKLIKSYLIVKDYIVSESKDKDDTEKIELLKLGIKLTNKINVLMKQNTKDLEKKLKKIENPQEIIKILELDK